jgi:hypothetical protein
MHSSPLNESGAAAERDRRLPDFVVLGAMKAGTTALYHFLERRDDVFMTDPKEPNFFSIPSVYERGPEWYTALFSGARPDQICGEASPSYTRFPRFPAAAERMWQLIPQTRLIYLMRHPVERFYSNYVFDRAFGHRETIRQTLAARPYVLETSKYIRQIERYLEFFPREQLHLVVLEDLGPAEHLQDRARATIMGVLDFLGLSGDPDSELAAWRSGRANERGRQHVARSCHGAVRTLRGLPGMSRAKRVVPQKMRQGFREYLTGRFPDSRLGRMIGSRRANQAEPLTAQLRGELLKRLEDSTCELEAFLGRDLSAWRE